MADIDSQWEVNPNVMRSFVRTSWLASIAALIIFTNSKGTNSENENYTLWMFALSLYLIYNSALTIKYFINRKQRRVLFLQNGVLHIPRFLLKDKKIKIFEIISMEKYSNSKGDLGVLVGCLEKSTVFLDKNNFISTSDFDDFVQTLSDLTLISRTSKSRDGIDALIKRQRDTTHLPIAVISLILSIIYLFSSAPGFEKISDSFLFQGCLNKQTMHLDQIYRISSSFLLHLSPLHLGLNILCFALLGRNILVVLGQSRFINIFFLSGVVGALASLLFSRYDAVIGASGGVLGLLGGYTCIWLKHNKELPGSVSVSAKKLIMVFAIQLAFDVIEPGVDVSSHIGGFIVGFGYTAWVLKINNLTKASEPTRIEQLIAVTVTLIFAYAFQKFIYLILWTS